MKVRSIAPMVLATVFVTTTCAVTPGGSPAGSPSPTANPNQLALISPSPRPTATPTPRSTAAPTASLTPTAAPTPSPSSAAPKPLTEAPGTPHVDPALEAFLPTTLSKTPLIRASVAGSAFLGGSDMCIIVCGDEPARYAKELGVTIDDVTVAFAVGDRLAVGMIAYRVRGAKTERLIPARIAIGGFTGHGFSFGLPVAVAGRPATYLDAGFGNGEYLMTRHDVLFIVFGEAPTKGSCKPGSCASPPPGPWKAPSYVTEALGGVL